MADHLHQGIVLECTLQDDRILNGVPAPMMLATLRWFTLICNIQFDCISHDASLRPAEGRSNTGAYAPT